MFINYYQKCRKENAYAIIFWGSILGYFWSNRAPRWLIDKRDHKPRKRIADYVAKISKKQLDTTYYTEITHSNGRKEKDYSSSFLGPFLGIAVWLLYYGYFFMLLPLHFLITSLRNYVFYK